MRNAQAVRWSLVLWLAAVPVWGQRPVPLADRPHPPLLPSTVTDLPVILSGELAYLFKDDDGSDVVHVVGEFACDVGAPQGQRLTSRQAVVWISHRVVDDRSYRHLELFLWRDAQIVELGGTTTSGPVLFATLDCSGPLSTQVDRFAFESSTLSDVVREGRSIRASLAAAVAAMDEQTAVRVFDPTGLQERKEPRPKPIIQFQSRGDFKGPLTVDEHRVITVLGRVYLSRGLAGSGEFLDLQADSAVVFLSPATEKEPGGEREEEPFGGQAKSSPPTGGRSAAPRRPSTRGARKRDQQLLSAGFGEVDVQGAYLEGDVLMTMGPNLIRASSLYYDFTADRALILDAVVRTTAPDRNVPLYLRAAEIRQLSSNHFSAEHARITTSEFHTPHYHVGAQRIELINRTPPDPTGKSAGIRAGSFRLTDATLNWSGVPIAYWPSIKGTVDTSETAIRSVRAGYSDDFGVELETKWHLFHLLGLEEPEGFDTSLSLDYFSERGPAVGVDSTYAREKYYGLLRSYVIADDGEDSLGEDREDPSTHSVRGRFLVRHRDYLEDDWQLTLEAAYISDRSFLEEFFESEFDNEKEQETLLYLKKQRDNWAFTAHLQGRLLDFTTQTERFPDLAYFRIGEPLALPAFARPVLDQVTWFSENRAGLVRFRAADPTFEDFLRYGATQSSGMTLRADSRQEVTVPLDVGALRLVPFAAVRGTIWDDSPEDGGLARLMGLYGIRGSLYLSRAFPDWKSTLFDLDGVRHLIKSDVTAWLSHANVDSDELYPFDPTVEGIDEVDGVTWGIRQRWQTRRGTGANRRNVDVFTLDTEVGVFNDGQSADVTNGFTSYSRPENSISHNYVNNAILWRINDRTALLNEINFDLNDAEVDVLNISYAVERSPRFSYLLGYRFIDESESNLLGLDINYRLTEKHTIALREAFDLDRGQTLDFTIALIRKHPRWFTALSFEIDEAEDDIGVSFTLWPEGIKQAAIGSRRFTSLANTTRFGSN